MSRRTLVSLVSDQPAPNLMLILDPAFAGTDRYLFVSTPEMDEKQRVDDLISAAKLSSAQVERISIPADDPLIIHQKLEAVCPSPNESYWVNLTGGTKVMSLAVGHYFSQSQFQAEMFYLALGETACRRIYPLSMTEAFPLQYRFSLQTYLTAYGIQEQVIERGYQAVFAVEKRILKDSLSGEKPIPGIEKPIWWFAGFLDHYCEKELQADELPLDEQEWIRPWLNYLGYEPLQVGKITRNELRYLKYAWLEHYVRNIVCRELGIPLEATAVGTKLYRAGADWKYRNNEFDVIFLYQNRVHIIECKTAMRKERTQTKALFNNSLYKLAALKKDFGLNVRVSLLTLSKSLRKEKKGRRRVIPDFNRRAELFDIPVVDYDCLLAGPGVWLPHLLRGNGLATTTIE